MPCYAPLLAPLSRTLKDVFVILQGALEDWDSTQRRILADAVRTTRDGPLFQVGVEAASCGRLQRRWH